MEKKHLTLIIVALIVAFGAYIYIYPPKKTDSNSNTNNSRPSTLRASLIAEMTANYRRTQLKAIENDKENAVENDARSILFDLDTLKKFINDIESNVKLNQPNENKKLAIRMYYAAYPSNTKWANPGYENLQKLLSNDITKLYERKHTLILLPVIKNKRGIYTDFNPLDINTYEGFKRKTAQVMSFIKVQNEREDVDVMSLNHGQIIPPATNEGQAF